MLNPFSLLTGWKLVGAAALGSALVASFGTYKIMHNANLAGQTKQAVRTVELRDIRGKITFDVAMNFEAPRLKIQQDTERRLSDVPIHITPEVDRGFPVPCSFVRVFNDAAHGPLPDPAGCPDDAPSDITFSEVGKTETVNAGQYDLIAAQLTALQIWVLEQQRVKP